MQLTGLAYMIVLLALVGACKKSESATANEIAAKPAPAPAVAPVAPAPVVAAPNLPTEAQAIDVATLWLRELGETDMPNAPAPSARMNTEVTVEEALDDEQWAECPEPTETVARERAADCAIRAIGWIAGPLSRSIDPTTTTKGDAREVVASLEALAVRPLESALRVEMTVVLDANKTPVIRRVRFSNPK